MKKVRAKFEVVVIHNFVNNYKEVELSATSKKDGDNIDFTPYTPSGNIMIAINGESTETAKFFTPGKVVHVDFIEIGPHEHDEENSGSGV